MNDVPVAIVTGAARGIGAATARFLAADGWRLALLDVCEDDPVLSYPLATQADLEATAAACGHDTITVVADVRDQASLDAAVGAVVELHGRLDAAVAAAGAIAGGPRGWETGDDVWATMLDINLGGVFHLARAALPAMLEVPRDRRQGRFVAVASTAAVHGLPQLAAYTAAKHGVAGLVRALAAELGTEAITANVVCPGSTMTAMLEASASVYDLHDVEVFAEHQRIGRLLEPEEIAAAIVWLCSPAASGVTGAILPVDGAFGPMAN